MPRATAWVLVVLASAAVLIAAPLTDWFADRVVLAAASLMTTALAVGLAVRTGGRPVWAGVLSAVLVTGALVSDWGPAVAGAAVISGVLAALLAVMATVPAATFGRSAREVVVALALSWTGALAMAGYVEAGDLDLDVNRLGYVVLGLSVVVGLVLVYGLGAGLHGLGRRGYVIAVGAVVLLAAALAYSEAIAHWGSQALVRPIDELRQIVRDHLGAVPHPIVTVLGIPALVWGTFMRARRRQGWWVCAFGVAATAPTTTRLIDRNVGLETILLSGLYSLLAGLAIGYVVIRAEQYLTGSKGHRARRDEEAEAHRPEPGRFRPLH